MSQSGLVLDANILISAVLGLRVRPLLHTHSDRIDFFTPAICLEEARRNLLGIAERRALIAAELIIEFDKIVRMVQPVWLTDYSRKEASARERISRHLNDWPIVATALLLECPIWTQDPDFFGCGIATWTTATVEIYLREATLMAERQ
jgi:predicted nucleic acid-binding protein